MILATVFQAGARGADDANQLVISALRDQGRGLVAESTARLNEAIAKAPDHELAQSLLGKVHKGDHWVPYETAIEKRPDADATYQRYLEKRAEAAPTAEAQIELGDWCQEQDMRERAIAHWTAATRLDPNSAKAWTRLGCRKMSGRWVSEEQIAEEREEAARRSRAEAKYLPIMSVIAKQLRTGGADERAEAQRRLDEVDDIEALPSVWETLVMGRNANEFVAAKFFEHITAPEGARALTLLGVNARSQDVQKSCAEALLRRDPRDYAGTLIGLLASPVRFTTGRASMAHGGREFLVAEGADLILRRLYTPLDPFDAFQRANAARGRMIADLAAIQAYNRQVKPWNEPIVGHLVQATGRKLQPGSANNGAGLPGMAPGRVAGRQGASRGNQAPANPGESIDGWTLGELSQFGYNASDLVTDEINQMVVRRDDRESWKRWWLDQEGMTPVAGTKRVVTQRVYVQAPPPPTARVFGGSIPRECFVAGTPVLTESGPRPIETLELGDLVLSQDVTTGQLGFRPIVALHHNPPQPTISLRLAGQDLVCTPTHRFWQVGQGWVMARALKSGDLVRSTSGPLRVVSTSAEGTVPVFNLEIEKTQTYMIGNLGVLSHDYGPVAPVRRPFDSPDKGPLAATDDDAK
jgi:hypothetical protein